MNKVLFVTVFAIVSGTCCLAKQYEANFSLRVVDDDNTPVSNASVAIAYELPNTWQMNNGKNIWMQLEGKTDTNGVYKYRGAFGPYNKYFVKKQDYYDTYDMSLEFTNNISGRLQPWDMQFNARLRPKVNPIAMYASRMNTSPNLIPELNKPFGFDLMKSDWVSPFGKGETADFVFKLEVEDSKVPPGYYEKHLRGRRRKNEKLTLSFSNVDDGIQCFISNPRGGKSGFRSPRYAPETEYETNFVSIFRADIGYLRNDMKEDQNYVFRVRTKRDDHGVITNAFYGKIYGPIEYDSGSNVHFVYYLNPTSLDRNLEFDRTKNLFEGVVRDQLFEP